MLPHLIDWHSEHIGLGGWRSVSQSLHCWVSSLPSSTPSHHQALSCPSGGRSRVGLPAMRRLVKQSRYGNSDIGKDVTRFWLDGPLAISADEQILFLEDLYLNRLPFSPRSTKIVKEIPVFKRPFFRE